VTDDPIDGPELSQHCWGIDQLILLSAPKQRNVSISQHGFERLESLYQQEQRAPIQYPSILQGFWKVTVQERKEALRALLKRE
jgi:hypothetical protein